MKTKTQFKNRILSFVLVLVMVFSMLPGISFTAFAADTPVAYAATQSPCSGDHSGWTAISRSTTITKPGKYYLTADITAGNYLATVSVETAGEVTLCLNGKNMFNKNRAQPNIDLSMGTFNLCDCVGTGCVDAQWSYAILSGSGTFNMYGGTLKNGYHYSGSAQGVSHNGTFNMYGGTITGCGGENSKGAAVCADSINIYGGSITGNGRYGVMPDNGGSVYISGDAKITGNESGDVYLPSGATLTLGTLTSGAEIGVTSASGDNDIAITGKNTADYAKYFHADNAEYQIVNKDNVLYLHKHSYSDATCVKLATCSCGDTIGEVDPTVHAPSTEWIYENGYHYHKCLYGCGAHVDETPCSGGEATCVEKAVCDTCGNYYGEKKMTNHVSEGTYYALIDNSEHGKYHSCCGTLIEKETHNDAGAAATCTGIAECSVCGSSYGDVDKAAHTGEADFIFVNNKSHGYKWDCCGLTEYTEDHKLSYTADDETDTITAVCSACGAQGAYTLITGGGTYNGYAFTASYSYTGIFYPNYNALVFPTITYCCEGGCIKAGEHTATMTLGDTSVKAVFTIAKKPLTLKVQVAIKEYDGTNVLLPGDGYELDGVVIYSLGYYEYADFDDVRDDVKIDVSALTITAPDVVPGEYDTVSVSGIKLFGEDADNYTIEESSDSVPVKDWLGSDGVYIYEATVTICPEDQVLEGDAELDQDAYEIEGLKEQFEIEGIELKEDANWVTVVTDNIKITLNGENVTKYFDIETRAANLSKVCEGHEFDGNGFCATGQCETYEPAKEVIVTDEDGGEQIHYEIWNAGQLYWFAEQVNRYYRNDIDGVLMADITVNDDLTADNLRSWTPIGSSYPKYCGDFEGNGYSISGLYFKDPEASFVGLFGGTDYKHPIRNLGIKNSYFEGANYVGALAGYGGSVISNCYAENVVIVCNGSSGALVGRNEGTVENCYSNAGALVGSNSGTVENCYYLADEDTDGIDGTTAATAAQFASGEVAYQLQAGVKGKEYYDYELGESVTEDPEEVWGQALGFDKYPTLYGAKVYQVKGCDGTTDVYSNTNEDGAHSGGLATCTQKATCTICGKEYSDLVDHIWVDGTCFICGAEEPRGLPGDLDLDGDVDSDDLTLLARHVGGIELVEGQALANADVNGDGVVNSDDLTKHARYVGGIITDWDQD